jgi:modification target Cys-rich repeat protein
MRTKLTLNVEQLAVDSFDTSTASAKRGTVFGEQCTCYTQCTCPGCPTCYNTCAATCVNTCDDHTCAASCNGTCGATCDCSGYTECDCPASCLATACGPYYCCA